MKVFSSIINTIEKKGACYLILIDPDKISESELGDFAAHCENSGVDGFLIGGSLMINGDLSHSIEIIKNSSKLPTIIFPGSVSQVSPNADALLFISLISGRNADQLIGHHVMAAPLIKKYDIEPISTGYILIESGRATTVEYISASKPIPRHKPEIAAATALAAQYIGMKMIYLEAGSGADLAVPDETVKMVSSVCSIPVIVGGGLRDSAAVNNKVKNGAKVIVTGNYFEDINNWDKVKEFADTVHFKTGIFV
jgi:putative glycerol-1-phosphate prenyltransferase